MNVLSLAGTLFTGFLALTGLAGCEDSRDSELAALKASCEQHNGDSCSDLSDIYTRGSKDTPPDTDLALNYALKGCEYDSGRSCASLGILHAQGSVTMPKDFLKARDYFEKACSLNYLLGCDYLGFQYLKGDGVPRDYLKAAAFLRRPVPWGKVRAATIWRPCTRKAFLPLIKARLFFWPVWPASLIRSRAASFTGIFPDWSNDF